MHCQIIGSQLWLWTDVTTWTWLENTGFYVNWLLIHVETKWGRTRKKCWSRWKCFWMSEFFLSYLASDWHSFDNHVFREWFEITSFFKSFPLLASEKRCSWYHPHPAVLQFAMKDKKILRWQSACKHFVQGQILIQMGF